MACPYFRRTPPGCRAVAGALGAPPLKVVQEHCRGEYARCGAYRFTRAAGRLLNPADFFSWVVRRIPPGGLEPVPDPA